MRTHGTNFDLISRETPSFIIRMEMNEILIFISFSTSQFETPPGNRGDIILQVNYEMSKTCMPMLLVGLEEGNSGMFKGQNGRMTRALKLN